MWLEPLSQRGRTLSTAREVLRVLRFLQTHPEGVKPRTVAAYLGKSPHTAYYLLNTLCQEGFALKRKDGRYYPTSGAWDSPAFERDSLAFESLREIAVELNRASGCRSYLVALEGQEIFLKGIFGHQGQPGPKGLGARITRASHALAVGKAVLSLLGEGALDLLPEDLPTFTPKTLTRETLLNELELVRRDGLALDLEEYQEGLCCLAVPVRVQGQIAALGLAVTKGRFLAQGDKLAELLCGFVPKEV
jgi:IclR family acetate operon transcriptional repressor